jgi:hypothetical protein
MMMRKVDDMADSQGHMQGHVGGHPAMDYSEHEKTYKGFVHFTEVGTVALIAIVLALAVGGVKHAWFTASIGTIATLVATGIGLAAPSIAWRAPLVVALALLAALVLM